MVLNSRSYIDPRWQESVRAPSRSFETATVQIVDPRSKTAIPYDPVTGAGGPIPSLVVWPAVSGYGDQPYGEGPYGGEYVTRGKGNAWVEIIRTSQPVNGQQQATNITNVHVHIDLSMFGSTSEIESGFFVQVLDGDRDSILERRLIVIDKVTTGNLAVQRTLECRIDERVYRDA